MSKHFSSGFLPPIKRYVNAIERSLHLPWKEKARIMSDIATTIQARREAGESDDAIMAAMGTPQAVAAPFNQTFVGQYKGSAWRFVWLTLALICIFSTVGVLIYAAGLTDGTTLVFGILGSVQPISGAGIIGGADGPTAVFVTASPSLFTLWPLDMLTCAISLLSLYFLCRSRGTHGPRHFRIARILAGICAGLFCIRFFFTLAAHSLSGGAPSSLAGMFLSPSFILTAVSLAFVMWRTPEKDIPEQEDN